MKSNIFIVISAFILLSFFLNGCNPKEEFIQLDRTPTVAKANILAFNENASWLYYYWEAGERVDTIYGKTMDLQVLDDAQVLEAIHFKFSNEHSYPIDFNLIEKGQLYEIEISKFLLAGRHDTTDGSNLYHLTPVSEN